MQVHIGEFDGSCEVLVGRDDWLGVGGGDAPRRVKAALPHRIPGFPAAAHAIVKERVNAIGHASAEEFRCDSDSFVDVEKNSGVQGRTRAAMKRGSCTSIRTWRTSLICAFGDHEDGL